MPTETSDTRATRIAGNCLLVAGGAVALLGFWGIVEAIRTAPKDPVHGGAYLLLGSIVIAALGAAITVAGVIVRVTLPLKPGKRSNPAA